METAPASSLRQASDPRRLELLLDAVTNYSICMLDLNGFVASWNAGAERIKGYRAVEIIGQHFSRFFTPEDIADELPSRLLAEARATARVERDGWRVRKDGTRFWAETTLQVVRDETGELIGFANVIRDITRQKEAQDALHERESGFRLLVESVTDYAIYMLDPSGIITNWNTGAQRLKGYRPDEIIGQHFSRFYSKEDRASGMPARVLAIAAKHGRYEAEAWRYRKDGTRFWASVVVDAIKNDRGELLGFAKITRDITERRTAEDALRVSERQFRLLVSGVTDYALYMLDPNGIVSNWNLGAQRIKGYAADEIVGQHFSRFYTESDRAAGVPAHALHTAAHEGRFEAEGWRVRKDGTRFWANVIIDPIKDETGALIGFAKITRDITERRDAQLALQAAQIERSYVQKMEALGQLTGGVAHDFNNLLMIVSGHLRTIRKLVDGDDKGRRAADAIDLAARRGGTLTRQLLTFSRRQTLSPVVADIAARLDAFRTMVASSLSENVRLAIDIPPDTWPVEVDISEFELALLNISINARDAMPQGGMITISADNVCLARDGGPEAVEGEFVALTIADNGLGIAPDVLSRVFDPFFTTKPESQGSGLGLSQVHGFAHQSGGTVKIASDLGSGTRVTLFLPRAHTVATRDAVDQRIEVGGGGLALLVEDNPEVMEVTQALLEELGYRVHVASDARQALDALEHAKFDLVVSDIVMAGDTDGLGIGRAVRRHYPEIPVVLVSGYSKAADLAGERFTVLRKPYQAADLSQAIAKVIAEMRKPAVTSLVQLRDARRGTPPR